MKKNIKENICYIIIILFILLLSFIKLIDNIKHHNLDTSEYLLFGIVTLSLSFLTCFFLWFIKKKSTEIKTEILFLILGVVYGICFIFLAPAFTGSDDHNHFYRAFEISEGTLITPAEKVIGSKLPISLEKSFGGENKTNTTIKYKDTINASKIKLEKNKKEQYGIDFYNFYNNTALYSPVQYIPHVIGISIGKILNLNPIFLVYLGRIFNLLFFITLGYFAIKIIPKYKKYLLVILLCPVILSCATTLSSDAFTIGIIALFISMIYRSIYNGYVKKSDKLIFIILSVLLSVIKIVYLPFVFLLLLLPKKGFNKKRNKNIFITITLIISILLSYYWLCKTNIYFDVFYVATDAQKEFIFSHPFSYILIVLKTYLYNGATFISNMFVGKEMYHAQINIPAIASVLYCIVVAFVFINDNDRKAVTNKKEKVVIILIIMAIIALMTTALYIQCTANFYKVGDSMVRGIQGRYFLPILFLFPLLLRFKKIKINIEDYKLINIIILINYYVLLFMLVHFMF